MDVEKRINLTDKVIHGILQGFSNAVKDGSDYIPVEAYVPENFFEGTNKFLKNPSILFSWFFTATII